MAGPPKKSQPTRIDVYGYAPETKESELRAGVEAVRARLAKRRRQRMTRMKQFTATVGIVLTVSVVASWLIAWANHFNFRVVLVNFASVTSAFAVGAWVIFSLVEWAWIDARGDHFGDER